MKRVFFVGSSRRDLAAFPEAARRQAGQELFAVQLGREPADFKPLSVVGPGAYEIRVRDEAGAFRVIYVARFEEAIYVLHAFQKKSQKTPPADLDLAAKRFRAIGGQR